jgi:hypothetical protein
MQHATRCGNVAASGQRDRDGTEGARMTWRRHAGNLRFRAFRVFWCNHDASAYPPWRCGLARQLDLAGAAHLVLAVSQVPVGGPGPWPLPRPARPAPLAGPQARHGSAGDDLNAGGHQDHFGQERSQLHCRRTRLAAHRACGSALVIPALRLLPLRWIVRLASAEQLDGRVFPGPPAVSDNPAAGPPRRV